MNNIIACIVFNLIGVGASYFLSFLGGGQKKSPNWGTSIFWGSWAGLLFTYALWVVMPDRLDIACYITFGVSLMGSVFLFKENDIRSFLRSEYFVSFLVLMPLLFVVYYAPFHGDEVSHWVSLPKTLYYQNSLIPAEGWHTGNYTPLWTLQAVFFQFFTPSGFDASLIYAVRINLLLSFFFFIKEKFDLNVLKASVFGLGILVTFFVTKSAQNLLIEFPLCLLLSSMLFLGGDTRESESKQNLIFFFIALLSLYMLKKPLIAVFPAAFCILWIKGYKKQLFYFGLMFVAFYASWKFKTDYMNEPWQYNFKIEGLWDKTAIAVYQQIGNKLLQDSLRIFLFIFSMVVIYREKKDAFLFYIIFSLVYFVGLVITYIYAFPGYYEEAINASYVRYVKIIFVPALVYAIYILLSKSHKMTCWENVMLKKRWVSKYMVSFIAPLLFAFFYYPSFAKDVTQEWLRISIFPFENTIPNGSP